MAIDEHYPQTLLEFNDRFRMGKACRKYLYQLRWPNDCPRCGHSKYWVTKRHHATIAEDQNDDVDDLEF
ncbi:MAG: transposase [Deltaproteobacteria bacterium]|nr:transposase [Deltaproteobacteria bacterium]